MFKAVVLVMSLFFINSANATCRTGEVATIIWAGGQYQSGYQFSSYTSGKARVLPIGTKIIVDSATYVAISGYTYLKELKASVSNTRNLIDPGTNEVLVCEPLVKESGNFLSTAGYFGQSFVSCQ